MIQLTKRDGETFLLNPDLIERIEEVPDTHITLANGHHYVVMEHAAEVVERIVAFQANIVHRSFSPIRRRRIRAGVLTRTD